MSFAPTDPKLPPSASVVVVSSIKRTGLDHQNSVLGRRETQLIGWLMDGIGL